MYWTDILIMASGIIGGILLVLVVTFFIKIATGDK